MAVSRHSGNIEVQDGDQDDTNCENETTVTARRNNVEMSEEGHYERLDLQKIDNAVYEDLRTKAKKKDKGLPKSGRSPFRVVAGCLGMLSLILLGVNIAQAVHYHSNSNTLTSNYDALMQEKNQLQSDVNQLKTQTADKSCPSGWKTFSDSCYYRSTEHKTWQEARDYCRTQGADLVVINSREEQVFVSGLNPAGRSWIGLNRTEGSWTWVDGTPLTTQYWDNGYPRSDTIIQQYNCAAYSHWTDAGTWFNVLCLSTRATICEN